MKPPTKLKRIIRSLLILCILYLVLWCIGFYRVWSFQRNLTTEHIERGKEIELFITSLKIGQPADLVKGFPYSVQQEDKSEYVIWYYSIIDENSSVSNRGGPVYLIKVEDNIVTTIDKRMPLTHGDKFSSPLYYYPIVAISGLGPTADH